LGRAGENQSGRENYWGRGWENERDYDDRESRYGSYGRPQSERGYNYPTGFRSGERSGERYGERGRYDRGEDRGWFDRFSDALASWFGDEEAERRRRMDEQRDQRERREHRGRGPKGYRRSDERIKEDVSDRLGDDHYLDASDVEVVVADTEVTLTGTVNSRNDKRRAEDIADAVSGVSNVENRLRVKQTGVGSYGSPNIETTATPGTTTSSAAAGGGAGGTGRGKTSS
jgi:osmotically-inducible protein OsmY